MKKLIALMLCALLIAQPPMARASGSGKGLIGGALTSHGQEGDSDASQPPAEHVQGGAQPRSADRGAMPAKSQPTPSAPPGAEDYISALIECMQAEGLDCLRSGDSLSIGDILRIDVSSAQDAVESISITAQGDGSARSGEIISTALLCAIQAYSPYRKTLIRDKLLELISLTVGEKALPGLKISLEWSSDSLRMTLTPSNEAPPAQPDKPPRSPQPGNVTELIAYCAAFLPEGWTQTSYLSDAPSSALLNIYSSSSDVNALWDCAHDVLSHFWSMASCAELECDRLSIVFYSTDMTPLLSLGISRSDALSCAALSADGTAQQLMQELDRLSSESDVLIVRHYEDG